MRAIVLNGRIVKMLTLFVVIIPRLALSDANLTHSSRQAGTSIRELGYELDPEDNGNCVSLGALDIVFRTHNYGPPNVGVVLTDPRGRRIGFDPVTKKAWQALPVAQGYIDCDDLDGRGNLSWSGPGLRTGQRDVQARNNRAANDSLQREHLWQE